MMRLILIRHGETPLNAQRRYIGATDAPLSENGAAYIKKLAQTPQWIELRAEFHGIVVSSPLIRAAATAEILFGRAPGELIQQLSECAFGEFEGHTYDELKNRTDYIAWITDETQSVSPPGGESRSSFNARVDNALEMLLARSSDIAAVTHGGTIVRIMDVLFPGEKNFYQWQPGYGHGYIVNLRCGAADSYRSI